MGNEQSGLLQCNVVKPANVVEELPLKKLIEENYSLFAGLAGYMRDDIVSLQESARHARNSSTDVQEFVRDIRVVGERVMDADNITIDFLLEMNHIQRKAFFAYRMEIEINSKRLIARNRNVNIGKERFLDSPHFWHFRAPKSFLLVRSLERMKSTVVEYLVKEAEKVMVERNVNVSGAYDEGFSGSVNELNVNSRVGLSNSIVGECFLLLCYGISFSISVLALEVLQIRVEYRIQQLVATMLTVVVSGLN